jgi:hypothetical protein
MDAAEGNTGQKADSLTSNWIAAARARFPHAKDATAAMVDRVHHNPTFASLADFA